MTSYDVTVWTAPGPDGPTQRSGQPETTRSVPVAELADLMADPSTLVWLDLVAPSARELTELGAHVGLHPLEVEDALAPLERPKASLHTDHATFVTYALTPRPDLRQAISAESATPISAEPPDEGEGAGERRADHHIDHPDDAEPSAYDAVLEGDTDADFGDSLFSHTRITGFVFSHALITVRSDDVFALAPVRERWTELGEAGTLGPYGLVHGLLDVVVDQYFEAVQFLDDRIEDLEDDLFEPAGRLRGFQRRAYALRKELVALRRVVLPMRDVLSALNRRRSAARADHTEAQPRSEAAQRLEALYADLLDHVLRVAEWTESLRDMVGTVFETHLSLQDQRLNEVMKKLAGWAAIISVPTLITGWFGMNVPYPGHDSPVGLATAVALALVPVLVLGVMLRRLRWI